MTRWGPRSLQGQLLFAIALALLLAQSISAVLLYRAQAEMREYGMVHAAAFRLLAAEWPDRRPHLQGGRISPDLAQAVHRSRVEFAAGSPLLAGEAE